MIRLKSILVLLSGTIIITLLACGEDDPKPTGSLVLEFMHLVNNEPLQLQTGYTNANGDVFNISEFKYYLSNFKLINQAEGNIYLEPESYHLVVPEDGRFEIRLQQIPTGSFDRIEFALGVDSTHNYSIDQVGDLDPTNNMAWDWNTGYKFLLFEGRFAPDGNVFSESLVFHLGSDENYREFNFQTTVEITPGEEDKVEFVVDLAELFKNPNVIDFNQTRQLHSGPPTYPVAENYSNGMFALNEN